MGCARDEKGEGDIVELMVDKYEGGRVGFHSVLTIFDVNGNEIA